MANYTTMVNQRKSVSETLTNLALTTINEMLEDGEKVTIKDLVIRTGCSRDFFYKNPVVNKAYRKAVEQQTGVVFVPRQKVVLDEALLAENKLLREQLKALQRQVEKANQALQAQNDAEFEQIANL